MKERIKNHRIKLTAFSKPGVRVDNRTSWWWESFSSADWRTALTASHLKSFPVFLKKHNFYTRASLLPIWLQDSKFFQLVWDHFTLHVIQCELDMKTATWFCGEAGIMEIQPLSAHFQVLTSLERFPSPQCFLTSLKEFIVRHQKWVNPYRIFCFGKAFFASTQFLIDNVFSRVSTSQI